MKDIITEFHETGECKIDIELLKADWSDDYSISQFRDKYSLVKKHAKVQISHQQALAVIAELGLKAIESDLFRSGKTYRSKSNIISEIKRLKDINPKDLDLDIMGRIVLQRAIISYEMALNS